MILLSITTFITSLTPAVQNCHEILVHSNCSYCFLKMEELDSQEKIPWSHDCIIGDSWKFQFFNPYSQTPSYSMRLDSLIAQKSLLHLLTPIDDINTLYSLEYQTHWRIAYFYAIQPFWGIGSNWYPQDNLLWNQVKGKPLSTLPWFLSFHWNQYLSRSHQGLIIGISNAYRSRLGNISWLNEVSIYSHHLHAVTPFSIRGPSVVVKTEPTLVWKNLSLRSEFELEVASIISSGLNMQFHPRVKIDASYRFIDNASLHLKLQRDVYNILFGFEIQWTKKSKPHIQMIRLPVSPYQDTAWVAQWSVLPATNPPTPSANFKIPSLMEWQKWISIAPDALRDCSNSVPEWLAIDSSTPQLLFQTAPPIVSASKNCILEPIDWRNLPIKDSHNKRASLRIWKPVLLP